MANDPPTQPLTGYELDNIEGRWSRYVALRDPDSMETSVHDVPDLLAEVYRLRNEVAGYRSAICFETTCTNCAGMLDQLLQAESETDRLRAENDAHVRHLADIRRTLSKAGAHGQPEASGVRQLARCVESLREENERLEDELETVTEENSALLRKLEEQYRRRAQSANEVTRLRAELAQTESGASIAMDAGVTALQEVKRLETVRDDLKLINDRMAVDRLRLIDERDRLIVEREADADVSSDKALGWGSGH